MSTHAIDAVSLSIMWDRLVGITDEIISALIRSSFSTIVRESGDLSVVVLDTEGNSIAQGSYSVPSFTGTAAATLRYMLAKFPPDSLEPGDVIATNDAWMGTGHLFDINVMRPVFRNGRIAGYTMSITHLPDIGGLGFGAAAERFVRRLLDTRRTEVFVSGSSAALLSREIASSLRGRAWPVLIHPFSFEEACRHRGIPVPERPDILSRHERLRPERTFADWLRVGGFPEAQGLGAPSRHQLLRDYVDVAILRDVLDRHRVSNVAGLRWLARHLLGNAGGLFSVEKFHGRLKAQGIPGYGASDARLPGRLLPGAGGVDGVELRAPAHGQPAQGTSRRPGTHSGVRHHRPRESRPRSGDRGARRAGETTARSDVRSHAPGPRSGLSRPRPGTPPGVHSGVRRPFGCGCRRPRAARWRRRESGSPTQASGC